MINRPTRQVLALVAILASAALMSVISYQYFTSVASKIDELARSEVRSGTLAHTRALASSLESKLDEVADNLQLLAVAPAIRSENLQEIQLLIDTAQVSTVDITDAYVLMDRDGKVVWSTFFAQNPDLAAAGIGSDLSERPYFAAVRETHQPYSHILRSTDNITRMHFSYPVLEQSADGSQEFHGAVAAAFQLEVIGEALEDRGNFAIEGTITMADSEGTLLVAPSPEFIGMNYFTDEFQSQVFPEIIPSNSKDMWLEAITDAANSGSGTFDLSLYGKEVTIGYAPVFLKGEHLMILFYEAPHAFAGEYAVLADQERTFSIMVIVAIGAIAAGISAFTLSWDRALRKVVAQRTKDLVEKTRQLEGKTAELERVNEDMQLANERLSLAYKDLEKHDRMQVEFANIAAHELRTPIQPILATIEMLKNSLGGRKEVRITEDEINLLNRNADRLRKLSLEILDATRIESGTLRLALEHVDINEKITNVIKDTENLIPQGKDIKLEYHPEKDASGNAFSMSVMIDRLRIFEALSNLVRNAIKYSEVEGRKGVITITAKKSSDGREVIVSVKDNGVGIDPDLLSSLFTKFAADKERGGAGLGLFLAKNIIEAHGGKIWAESNKDGQGATFSFTLPLQPQA